jgi:hypothetical protein
MRSYDCILCTVVYAAGSDKIRVRVRVRVTSRARAAGSCEPDPDSPNRTAQSVSEAPSASTLAST